MSDVRAYVPGQTGSLSDVIERGPELAPFTPAGPGGFAPPSTTGELFHAYRVQNRAYRTDFDEVMLRDGYAPIVDALGLGGSENPASFYSADPNTVALTGTLGQPSDLATAAGEGETLPFGRQRLATRPLQEQLIAAQIHARRAKQPDFLPGVPDTVDGLHEYFRQQEANRRAVASATIERGAGGLKQALTGLAGGGVEAFHDPVNIATLAIGGGEGTLLRVVARDALVNGVLEAAQLPSAAHNLDELGEHLSVGGAIEDVLSAGVFGGFLGGTMHLAGEHVPPALFKVMPESVQQRWAGKMKVGEVKLGDVLGDMDNRELAGFARATIGEKMTPDERAAADTLERAQELGEASPFMPGPAGDAAHNASLGDTLKSIIDGAPRESPKADLLASTSLSAGTGAPPLGPLHTAAAAVPHDIVDFFKAKGLDEAHAYGIAAGIMAESGGDHTIVNRTSGASFLGQWLGARLEAIKARYGANPTREQQLEFLWHELSGGDAGGKFVLEAKDAGSVLDAYVRKFMRPAAGAETLGDLERGMAALGRKGELPEGMAEPGAGGLDEAAALQRSADEAEQDAIAAARDREGADVVRGGERPLEAHDYPILKRELFGSDADWFDAQLGFYRSQGLIGDAAEAAANGPQSRVAVEPTSAASAAERAPGGPEAPAGEAITAQAYVDAYLRGEGRGDTSRDRELLQFAVNNGTEIEAEFKRRAAAGERITPTGPLTMAELEEIGRPANARLDALWYAGLNAVHTRELGKEPTPLWALRDKRTGEVVSWGVKRAQVEAEKAKAWEPEHLDLERLHPENVATELRERAADQAARAAAADVRIDDPALKAFDHEGSGRAELADSLEHDFRMAAADPERSKRSYEIDGKLVTLEQLLEEFDRDREAAAALRACATLKGAA
jgi:hypothetical protein